MSTLNSLLNEIRACTICAEHLPLGPNPILSANTSSLIAIIGQAPGTRVHNTGIPWNDPSGDQLRKWIDVSNREFYTASLFAITPMGFCYPGKGKSGDLPPRPECARTWHDKLFAHLSNVKLTLLIGQYAQRYYLGDSMKKNLTETVRNHGQYFPKFIPLPHPSPRNRLWIKKNPWFELEVLPVLKASVHQLIDK